MYALEQQSKVARSQQRLEDVVSGLHDSAELARQGGMLLACVRVQVTC